MTIEKLVVIGCSYCGKQAVEYLVPRLNLNTNAAVVVPHIENKEIYESLGDLGVNVVGIEDDIDIKQGCVYVVDHKYPASFFENGRPFFENVKSLFKTVRFENGRIKPVYSFLSQRINYAIESAANNYHGRCIGVILSGSNNDGSHGVRCIKRNGGKVLVQIEGPQGSTSPKVERWLSEKMPKNAQKATNVDFAGPLSKLVDKINEFLNE